ncbi:Pr6Pr family membrane protein [Actinopolymorpha alba]|uniref:Pr6Pr family membrane protein n=1 Tax=Actinopolymorpha alba TaxID=533267 RepID=UPI0012F6F304|nr:Pr6Pr family membrane protein [Actinopolymorpha alba]
MVKRRVLAIVRLLVALLVLVAIGVQLVTNLDNGTFDPTRYFAFFTILSNLFGAGLLLVLALSPRARTTRSATLDLLRGAAVVYLAVTFVVVMVLLSSAELQVALPWVDTVVHKILPVYLLIDWLVDPPTRRLTFRLGLRWLIGPLIWALFTLVRGEVDGWYPYPFLDPANGGYPSVAIHLVAILIGFVVFSWVTVALANLARRRSHRRGSPG